MGWSSQLKCKVFQNKFLKFSDILLKVRKLNKNDTKMLNVFPPSKNIGVTILI